MEYSINETVRLTKQALLNSDLVFELYQTIYDKIIENAKSGYTSYSTTMTFDDKKYNVSDLETVIRVLRLEGYNAACWNSHSSECYIVYIRWENGIMRY